MHRCLWIAAAMFLYLPMVGAAASGLALILAGIALLGAVP